MTKNKTSNFAIITTPVHSPKNPRPNGIIFVGGSVETIESISRQVCRASVYAARPGATSFGKGCKLEFVHKSMTPVNLMSRVSEFRAAQLGVKLALRALLK